MSWPRLGETIRRVLMTAMLLGSAASAVAFLFLQLLGTGRVQMMLTFYLYSLVALLAAAFGYRHADMAGPGSVEIGLRDVLPVHRVVDWFRPDYRVSVRGRRFRATAVRIEQDTVSLWIEDGRRSYGITYPRDDLMFVRPMGDGTS